MIRKLALTAAAAALLVASVGAGSAFGAAPVAATGTSASAVLVFSAVAGLESTNQLEMCSGMRGVMSASGGCEAWSLVAATRRRTRRCMATVARQRDVNGQEKVGIVKDRINDAGIMPLDTYIALEDIPACETGGACFLARSGSMTQTHRAIRR